MTLTDYIYEEEMRLSNYRTQGYNNSPDSRRDRAIDCRGVTTCD